MRPVGERKYKPLPPKPQVVKRRVQRRAPPPHDSRIEIQASLRSTRGFLRFYGHARLLQFVTEYLIDEDPRQAAVRSGVPAEVGAAIARRSDVVGMITSAKRLRGTRAQIFADDVIRRLALRATATITDVVETFDVCCRHCWGIDHEYQFTAVEMRHARARHEYEQLQLYPDKDADKRALFNELGGDGFDPWAAPNPDCTECGGRGSGQKMRVKDTSELSERGRMVVTSIRQHTDGSIEVKLQDPSVALRAEEMLARYLGMVDKSRRRDFSNLDDLEDSEIDSVLTLLEKRGYLKLPPVIDQEAEDAQLTEP